MRLQLALNVSDLDEAVDFYTRMFGVEPAKIRPGYANFAVADPPLKLVLFEGQGEAGSINHLGVETESADEVVAAEARLTEADLETTGVDDTQCCYAAEDRDLARRPRRRPLGVVREDGRQRAALQPGRRLRRRHLLPGVSPRRLPGPVRPWSAANRLGPGPHLVGLARRVVVGGDPFGQDGHPLDVAGPQGQDVLVRG